MLKRIELSYDSKWHLRGKKAVAGTDEAGRGPLAGPVVAAAVIFNVGTDIVGLNDSKKLSEKKRESLYDIIIERCLCWSVAVVDNKVIDDINILNAALLAMKNSVSSLTTEPDVILIDGKFTFNSPIETEAVIKGDGKSLSIAAASVLAKVSRDRIMEEYDKVYPEYGFKRHKGYPTKAHYEAIVKYGVSPIHRLTFRLRNCDSY